jgi:hypothetical protein
MPRPLPLLESYLAVLPGGADAHPQCQVKASIVRNALETKPIGADLPLPAGIRALVDTPPPISAWVPEVHFNALMLVIRDAHFEGDAEPFRAWMFEQSRRLLGAPIYRVLFLVMSPERLLVGLEKRWGAFRKGTDASSVEIGPNVVELRLRAPPHLYTAAACESMRATLRAAVTCAGAADAEVDATVKSPTEVAYRVRWR